MNSFRLVNQTRMTQVRLVGFFIAMILMGLACLGLAVKGLNLGLEFSGGQIVSFSTAETVSQSQMRTHLQSMLPQEFLLNQAENGTYWTLKLVASEIQSSELSWLGNLQTNLNTSVSLHDSTYIGSQVGAELLESGGMALLVSLILMLFYLSWRFEWRLAAGASLAVLHDVLVVLGLFAWFGFRVDLNVLASVLAVIGYSINDSIVVGDRIRELMKIKPQCNLNKTIDSAVGSTLTRTLITSGTTIATVVCIGVFAGEDLTSFAIAMFVGVLVGSFSSITVSATLPEMLGLKASFYDERSKAWVDENP